MIKEVDILAKKNKERTLNSKEEEELWESIERDDEEDEEYDEADYEWNAFFVFWFFGVIVKDINMFPIKQPCVSRIDFLDDSWQI